MGPAPGPTPWYIADAAEVERVNREIAQHQETTRNEVLLKSGRVIKVIKPHDSGDGKWEAVWSGGHLWTDSFTELFEALRRELGIEAGQ
jgi:hypothetical protein